MRNFLCGLVLVLAFGLNAVPVQASGQVMITTYAEDFQITNGNIGCPKGPWGNAFAVNIERLMGKMPVRDMEQLMRLIQQFESRHGVQVESKTRTENFQTTSDKIRTESTGPATGVGAQLCQLAGQYV